jgi:S-adenosylmethionine synthetase
MIQNFMYTSESVTEGHPDKLCDQISDAIVDHFLTQDPGARVRAECAVAKAIVFIAARFSSTANIDFARLARKVIQRIGYNHPDFNPLTCSILTSPLALPVNPERCNDESRLSDAEIEAIPAKNQVTAFGFACNQTEQLMPLPIFLAHRIARRLTDVRKEKLLPYVMPDGKAQVGVEFKSRKPDRIHSITIEIHTDESQTPDAPTLRRDLLEHVLKPVFEREPLKPDSKSVLTINPDGIYHGGPMNHSGLTGRKNAVDTYGEFAHQGSKALSGKDPGRIDRSAAYAARYAAKNIVAAGLAAECEVMLSYAAGVTRPITLIAQTFGTGSISDEVITLMLQECFDFRPAAILKNFALRQLPRRNPLGFYQNLATYGHFGRGDMVLPWEQTDKVEELRHALP